ncbi:hypothetical protein [Streptomyces violaceusniger]|uniref:Uncharacterized protein n=1 Tax=Streptomyces violaceusniger (strain Tu 4113) TaxID=653045 RepID=G2PHX5_STRV4|nr:hypothetical protein [Streptomyces violaceusniger]AEM88926.1 hypothetical protein Strvi_0151 [Streptomyces violaceusniger Tu 4113]
MADPTTPPPEQEPPRGNCPCGTTEDTPAGWCGLMHHGLGCHHTDTVLVDVPRRRASPSTVAVCLRCAVRARWWLDTPAQREETYEAEILGRVLLMEDGTRNPLGHKPPHVPF